MFYRQITFDSVCLLLPRKIKKKKKSGKDFKNSRLLLLKKCIFTADIAITSLFKQDEKFIHRSKVEERHDSGSCLARLFSDLRKLVEDLSSIVIRGIWDYRWIVLPGGSL